MMDYENKNTAAKLHELTRGAWKAWETAMEILRNYVEGDAELCKFLENNNYFALANAARQEAEASEYHFGSEAKEADFYWNAFEAASTLRSLQQLGEGLAEK